MMNKKKFKERILKISQDLEKVGEGMQYCGDISDIGNEIGFIIGSNFHNMTEEQITDFIHGFRHGVSLTNGTH